MNILTPETEYYHEPHLVSRCIYHIIFCTKYRRKVLNDIIQNKIKEIIIDKQKEYNYILLEQEIMLDHVHILISCSAKISIHSIVSKIKGFLANKLRSEFPELKSKLPCLWSNGKFISSVGSVSLETVKKYIENQKNI